MRTIPRLAGLPKFGFLYGITLLLIVIPMVLICALGLGVWPWSHSVGLEVRTTKPAFLVADAFEDPVIISVQSAEGSMVASESRLRLNLKPVSWDGLRDALRARLSRSPHRVVYVEGDDLLEFGNIVRVIDIARDAYSGVPVVLLTPALKKTLMGKSEGPVVGRGSKPSSATRP
jgi:biopolymer transport protein ExbD